MRDQFPGQNVTVAADGEVTSFVEIAGQWIRGRCHIVERAGVRLIEPLRGWVERYELPRVQDFAPTQVRTAGASGKRRTTARSRRAPEAQPRSPLLDLLQLSGVGASAEDLTALHAHYANATCGRCPRCRRVEERIVDYCRRWGPLGLSALDFLGDRDLSEYWKKGAFGRPDAPLVGRPEAVELFLYAAALLRAWWGRYRKPPTDAASWQSWEDLLIWGAPPGWRARVRAFFRALATSAGPERLPAALRTEAFVEEVAGFAVARRDFFLLMLTELLEVSVIVTGSVPGLGPADPDRQKALEALDAEMSRLAPVIRKLLDTLLLAEEDTKQQDGHRPPVAAAEGPGLHQALEHVRALALNLQLRVQEGSDPLAVVQAIARRVTDMADAASERIEALGIQGIRAQAENPVVEPNLAAALLLAAWKVLQQHGNRLLPAWTRQVAMWQEQAAAWKLPGTETFPVLVTGFRGPYEHPGLNQVLADLQPLVRVGCQGPEAVYQFPTLWHAIHAELRDWLTYPRAKLQACSRCGGPIVQWEGRRGRARTYCSNACKQAAHRHDE